MDEFIINVYEKLVSVSKNKGLIYYFELNKCLPLKNSSNFLNPFQTLFNTLNKLNEELKKQDLPLLTSLVVNKNSGRPGKGFFYYSKTLGIFNGNVDSDFEKDLFWKSEKEKVYKHEWNNIFLTKEK
ncbi:MAG: hypothetical protein M0R46_01105 [Candidatus Muirbacterium halophilum]|nr:hypothetical protein [Candidatus Muirbacterium halophilum]MCK9474493.1 hypothetical protein [Candidatus Muirbacterium halophilum]